MSIQYTVLGLENTTFSMRLTSVNHRTKAPTLKRSFYFVFLLYTTISPTKALFKAL